MDKVKKFLEAYVQWLAVALGVAFLGWTVYGYVVYAPVTATVNNEPNVTPPEINVKVADGPARTLDEAMRSTQAPAMIPIPDYPKLILGKLGESPASVAMNMPTPSFPYPTPIDDSIGSGTGGGPTLVQVPALPEVPTLVEFMWSKGHSNVQPPTQQNPQNGGLIAANLALDKQWISVGANIPVADLAKNFKDDQIPPTFCIATIYRVIAEREEQDAAGNWVNPTTLQPLDVNPMMALPPKDCDFQARQDYKTWAETQQNVVLICEPSFYSVLQGDIWYEPGFPDPNDRGNQAVVNPFDPTKPLAFKGDPNLLLPDEKDAWDKAKADQAAAEARKNRAGQQPTNPNSYNQAPGTGGSTGRTGRGTGGGGGHPAAPEPTAPNEGGLLGQPRPGSRYAQPPSGYMPPPMAQPNQSSPVMPPSSVATLPNPGSFSPADRVATATATGVGANIKVWVHDPDVQAGKTYHYRLKYIISNPVAGTTNLCKNPADTKVAWIESAFTKWSEGITVDSDSNFYAVDAKHGIRFDIFKWKNGVWQKQTVDVMPGDRIGHLDTAATHTDFDTGWTLVDIREDPAGNNENKVLVLVSDNGTMKEKEISSDRQNEKYRKLLGEVQAAAEKTASR